MKTKITTKTKPTASTGDHWPPLVHKVRAENYPVKAGDRAICGATLVGLNLHGKPVSKWCQKCLEIAKKGWI